MSHDEPSQNSKRSQSTNVRVLSAVEARLSNRQLCEFYKEYWARPIALEREDFTDWQMNDAPLARGGNHSIVAIENDQIVALMGCTPLPFRLGGDAFRGAALTTWVVSPASRGKGVGTKILADLQNRYDLLVGSGISDAALPLYLSAGFTYLSHMQRFFYIADFGAAESFTSISLGARRITESRQGRADPLDVCAKPVLAAELATQAVAFDDHHLFQRDAPHLSWRYDKHPAFHYEAFLIFDRSAQGDGAGIVLRSDAVDGVPFIHIVDLFGDPADLPAAISFAEAEAARRGAAFVDMSGTSGVLSAVLRARGWSSSLDDPLIQLPSLFYPVELRHPPTTSLALWSRSHQQDVYDLSRLHVSRGDMDLDRPTMDWYERHAP
jgi:GNAT superfamily N-acetyltransferase